MKQYLLFLGFLLFSLGISAQKMSSEEIIQTENILTSLEADIPGLNEKLNVDLSRSSLSIFLQAISEVHKININPDVDLSNIEVINGFKNVLVKDVLLFLCKTYNLQIDVTGSILSFSIKQYVPEEPEKHIVEVFYNPTTTEMSVDLINDNLAEAFKKISEVSGKGIFFTQELGALLITSYINNLPFDVAMDKIAFANNLIVTKTDEGYFEFNSIANVDSSRDSNRSYRSPRNQSNNGEVTFQIIDFQQKKLSVNFNNTPISSIVNSLAEAFQLDVFTATPLEEAGSITFKATNIDFDTLLVKVFESVSSVSNQIGNTQQGEVVQNVRNTNRFTFRKIGDVYYFGTAEQLTQRTSELIPLFYRSIEMLDDPSSSGRTAGRTTANSGVFRNSNFSQLDRGETNDTSFQGGRNIGNRDGNISSGQILALIPEDLKRDITISIDTELNSFIASGPSQNVERFRRFVKEIDKPVPMVLIEVLILEIGNNNTLDAGIEWGIGGEPATTQGQLFPNPDVTLGSGTINRILGRIDGSSFFNIGSVVPNFFANIKAMESNGAFKIRSSPRIATLNGHRAYFSNGETSYYAVTNRDIVGVQNTTITQTINYLPIDAELSLDVKPFVAANGDITMDIKVIQSSFNGQRIAPDAPPGLNSREFTSIVNARNNDIIVLGGLEEKAINNNGSGIPFLARIPIIKWLFSKRVREARKSKLTVLIKPTIIY